MVGRRWKWLSWQFTDKLDSKYWGASVKSPINHRKKDHNIQRGRNEMHFLTYYLKTKKQLVTLEIMWLVLTHTYSVQCTWYLIFQMLCASTLWLLVLQHATNKEPICGVGATGIWPLSIIFRLVYICIDFQNLPDASSKCGCDCFYGFSKITGYKLRNFTFVPII